MKISLDINLDTIEQDTELLNRLGYALEHGTIFEQDYEIAYQCYLLSAEAGNELGMNNLGWMCQNGFGTPKDILRALKLYHDSAELGCAQAMVNLGNIYEFGCDDIPIDDSKAFFWYKKAAELEDEKGLYNYANLLHWGRGTEQNREEAFRIFVNLYNLGVPETCFYMGMYYQNGYVVAADAAKARTYYEEGMALDDPYCIHQLGVMCSEGKLEGLNPDQSIVFYERAAELGNLLSIEVFADYNY